MLYADSHEVCPKCRSDMVYDADHKNPRTFCINCAHEKLKRENDKLKRQLAKRDAIIRDSGCANTRRP